MTLEARYGSGPFAAKDGERLWLSLAVYEDGSEVRQVVVRVPIALTEHTAGPGDPFWWFVCRSAAEGLQRRQGALPSVVEVTADDLRQVLHSVTEPERLVENETVLLAW